MKLSDVVTLSEETTTANVSGGAHTPPVSTVVKRRPGTFEKYSESSKGCPGCKIISNFKMINYPKKEQTCQMCGQVHK